MERISWLKLDWDEISLEEAMRRINILIQYYEIFPRFYETAKGFHIELFLPEAVNPDESFGLRRLFWDDSRRIELDKLRKNRGEPYDILFTDKNGTLRKQITLKAEDFLKMGPIKETMEDFK